MAASLSAGSRLPRASEMPASAATVRAVSALSPLSMTGTTPSAFSADTACALCGRMASATANRASTRSAEASRVTVRPCVSCRRSASSRAGLHRPCSSIRRWLPSSRRRPSSRPSTPRPGNAEKASGAGPSGRPSPRAIACDTGWSEWPARPAAQRSTRASSMSSVSSAWATSRGRPSVSVPVLSSATARRVRAPSRWLPPLISTPRRAADASPLTMVTGVDSTSAQGQAITRSTSAV